MDERLVEVQDRVEGIDKDQRYMYPPFIDIIIIYLKYLSIISLVRRLYNDSKMNKCKDIY